MNSIIVQIPCHNEANTLPLVFERMPRRLAAPLDIQFLLIDDGSSDGTQEVARTLGISQIVSIPGPNRRWLGRAFRRGIDEALRLGADVVVNTDGDNQYPSEKIPELILPILEGRADIVVGNRRPESRAENSYVKRCLYRIGRKVIESFAQTEVPDAVCGFRAYSREALLQLHIVTDHTYTVDSLIQAYHKGLSVVWLPIEPNQKTRESRLFKSVWEMSLKSAGTLLRLALVYRPLRTFVTASLFFFIPATAYLSRFLYFYFLVPGKGSGNVQSLVISGAFLVIAVLLVVFGVLGDALSVYRRLIEDSLTRIRRMELKQK